MIALSDGGCAVAGSTESFGHGASDMYFLRLSSDGEVNIFNSITPPNKEAFVFYPNPMLHVGNFELPDTGTANRFTVQLFDSYGHLVRQRTMNGTKYTLNRENLSSGTYFYSIVSEDVPGIRYKGKLIA